MNELNRQAYLSALGIENYVPRWHLPTAPVSIACVLPIIANSHATAPSLLSSVTTVESGTAIKSPGSNLLKTIPDITEQKKAPLAINAAAILQQLEEKKSPVIQPFSLAIYRPLPGFLVIDSRYTKLALPTEVLLKNILRAHLKSVEFVLAEEVLRWPMIENQFVPRTENDVRNELQTWLAVENELRPIHTLWLMGENAARYWLEAASDWAEICWTTQPINDLSLQALVFPSLNQLLQNPLQKHRLWTCLP